MRFKIESNWPLAIGTKKVNVHWIKDTITGDSMCVRQCDNSYYFAGWIGEGGEEKIERLVIKYECEQFFCKDPSYEAALAKFAINILLSSTRLE